jgi:hypothetical protein
MGSLLRVRSRCAKAAAGAKSPSLIAWAVAILVLGAWSGQAAELPTPKKPKAPAAAAPNAPATKSPPTLRSPQIKTPPESTSPGSRRPEGGKGPSISTSTTREPARGQDGSEEPEMSPCDKPNPKLDMRGTSRRSRPCPEEPVSTEEPEEDSGFDPSPDETEADSSGDPEEDTYPNEDPDTDSDSASGGDGDEYPEGASEEAGPPADFDELTGKIPGFKPFGGEESGSSESSTVEGGRPWYEKLGKPGGRPPVDDDE